MFETQWESRDEFINDAVSSFRCYIVGLLDKDELLTKLAKANVETMILLAAHHKE